MGLSVQINHSNRPNCDDQGICFYAIVAEIEMLEILFHAAIHLKDLLD